MALDRPFAPTDVHIPATSKRRALLYFWTSTKFFQLPQKRNINYTCRYDMVFFPTEATVPEFPCFWKHCSTISETLHLTTLVARNWTTEVLFRLTAHGGSSSHRLAMILMLHPTALAMHESRSRFWRAIGAAGAALRIHLPDEVKECEGSSSSHRKRWLWDVARQILLSCLVGRFGFIT